MSKRFHHQLELTEDLFASYESHKAVDILSQSSQLSKQNIKLAMKHGAVWLSQGKSNKRLRRASRELKLEDRVDIYFDEALLKSAAPEAVLLEDLKSYSVWYKPYGMLSQGSKWGDHHTINRFAESHLFPQRSAFIVHRLDRAASGLMLLAHKRGAAAKLSNLFKEREIEKHYQAIVQGSFPEEEQIFDQEVDGKKALTKANLKDFDKDNNVSLLDIQIESGRKHQIRKHLSDAGFPILGDRLYGEAKVGSAKIGSAKIGSAKTAPGKLEKGLDLQLSSVFLAFLCPDTGEQKQFILPDPLRLSWLKKSS